MSVERTLSSRPRDRHSRGLRRYGQRARWVWRHLVPRPLRRVVLLSAAGMAGAAVLGALATVVAVVLGVRMATRRVVVEGRSMVPTLEHGDRLLVVRLPRRWPLRPGDVIAVTDPRLPDRLLVKRVAAVQGGRVTVAGDNPSESTDSRSFGPVDRNEVWGRVGYRYAPAVRAGRVHRVHP